MPSLGLTTPNPAAGGLPGGVIFEGYEEGRCNCDFASNYPYGFGPRIGLAYQITPKTVFRAGWGISYGQDTAQNNFWSLRFGSRVAYSGSSFGSPATLLRDGVPFVPVWPDFNPGQAPPGGIPTFFLTRIDPNAGRPPRQMMWSIGIQREITQDLVVEASYVGNRGVWWSSSSMVDVNRITPEILAKNGLDINKQADRDLLTSRLNSAAAAARGFNIPPYAAFPMTSTVAQSLRPFPQFTGINTLWAPVGNTWYDSLQVKVTKRYSHGLDLTTAFSWQKELTAGAETEDPAFAFVTPSVNNVLDRKVNKYISGFSQPLRIVFAVNYTFPRLNVNSMLSWVLRDWTTGAVLQYASGRPTACPTRTTTWLRSWHSVRR